MYLQETKWTRNIYEIKYYTDTKVEYKLFAYDYDLGRLILTRYDKLTNTYTALYNKPLNKDNYEFCKKLFKAIIKQEIKDNELLKHKTLMNKLNRRDYEN